MNSSPIRNELNGFPRHSDSKFFHALTIILSKKEDQMSVKHIQYRITHTVTLFKHTPFHFSSSFFIHPDHPNIKYIFNYEAHHLVTFYFTLRTSIYITRHGTHTHSGVFMLVFFQSVYLLLYLCVYTYL